MTTILTSLPIQGDIKTTHPKVPALFPSLPSPGRNGDSPAPALLTKLFYLTSSICSAWIFPCQNCKDQDLLERPFADNICDTQFQEEWRGEIPICYFY
jgi:hypothetical protein